MSKVSSDNSPNQADEFSSMFEDLSGENEEIVNPSENSYDDDSDSDINPETDKNITDLDEGDIDDNQDPNGKRFAYWQSQAAKAKNENEELKKQLSTLTEHLDALTPKKTVKEDGIKPPEKPVKPTKPSNYSFTEAMTDGESDSAKYEIEIREYNTRLAEYNAEMIDYERNLRTQEQTKRQALEEKINGDKQIKNDLTAKYGYTQEQAQDFITFFENPNSLSFDALVEIHKSARIKKKSSGQQKPPKAPLPPINGGAGYERTETPDEQFTNSLVSGRRGSVLWNKK